MKTLICLVLSIASVGLLVQTGSAESSYKLEKIIYGEASKGTRQTVKPEKMLKMLEQLMSSFKEPYSNRKSGLGPLIKMGHLSECSLNSQIHLLNLKQQFKIHTGTIIPYLDYCQQKLTKLCLNDLELSLKVHAHKSNFDDSNNLNTWQDVNNWLHGKRDLGEMRLEDALIAVRAQLKLSEQLGDNYYSKEQVNEWNNLIKMSELDKSKCNEGDLVDLYALTKLHEQNKNNVYAAYLNHLAKKRIVFCYPPATPSPNKIRSMLKVLKSLRK